MYKKTKMLFRNNIKIIKHLKRAKYNKHFGITPVLIQNKIIFIFKQINVTKTL